MTDALAEGMSELATLLLSTADIAESVPDIADIVSRMLPGRPTVSVAITILGAVAGVDPALVEEIRSVHTEPLVTVNGTIGTLTVYADSPGELGERTRRAAALTASHLGVLLEVAMETARRSALTEQLRATLESRSVIDQALGIIMGRDRCSREDAFTLLRTISQHRNIKVATLAAAIVEEVSSGRVGAVHFAEPDASPTRSHRS
ncbi:ANTAR domain-containing protein [Nocardia sp. NPDC051030]|uniref:ANTAR domain-containing protein n=1 Tax=Nocardia sp. NPDC051030 TaxID=3155162 RepID=UPI00341E353A